MSPNSFKVDKRCIKKIAPEPTFVYYQPAEPPYLPHHFLPSKPDQISSGGPKIFSFVGRDRAQVWWFAFKLPSVRRTLGHADH